MKKMLLLAIACFTVVAAFSQDKKEKMPKSKTDTSAVPKIYTCAMDPEVLSDKPGKCPKCGMALTEKIMYVCPMHPEVVSDKPGKCVKCGMHMKIKADAPKQKGDTAHIHKM
jgi:hypothetical protein